MKIYFVSNFPDIWPKDFDPNVVHLTAREYIMKPDLVREKHAKVYNLCNTVKYQSLGYYVSLLAEARGHRPLPNIATIQDFNSQRTIKYLAGSIQDLIQEKLSHIQTNDFVLSIYFGRNVAKHYDRLCSQLYGLFPAPLMRAHFRKEKQWKISELKPISIRDVPPEHHEFLTRSAVEFFGGKRLGTIVNQTKWRYDLAILHNPQEKHPPSDNKALKQFVKAGARLGIRVEMIEKSDFSRLAEFDALFIRETTQVNHHTFTFARRAQSEGLIVMDDPESILRCTNKVYLAELLARHKIPTPKTVVVHRGNTAQIAEEIGFPCILKQPDSSFSQGVFKAEDPASLETKLELLFDSSELVIAQEFMPTDFDWRIGVINRKAFYACKYYMAGKHWQIIKQGKKGFNYGRFETIPVAWAPKNIVQVATKAANLIGDGLYGVDIKAYNGKPYLIEINDNPSLDADVEDQVLKDGLYDTIMGDFLRRIEEKKS
ncbi:MAG: RimK family protein [Acidobacteria bacterium]|nr:RimK family protein [Acidobacteriota bacterium]MCB9396773.1 RimK family protein [Acidobacteriota bacterium]